MNEKRIRSVIPMLILLVLIFFLGSWLLRFLQPQGLPYSQVLEQFQEENVSSFTVKDGVLEMTLHEPLNGAYDAIAYLDDTDAFRQDTAEMVRQQREKGTLTGYDFQPDTQTNVLERSIPYFLAGLALILVWMFLSSRSNAGGNGLAGFTRARTSLGSAGKPVTFDDVAGADEEKAELQEIVDFLRDPDRFNQMGAKVPKGVLLVGPPGTGKTLLARAVAGESGVGFLSISGSDFMELYVGVGASRVRDLFDQAKKIAPAIVFIDEIDAVGRRRGAGLGGGHDEREQTLNQLLVEMDGFQKNEGVIVLAATNRQDILDPALMRPGRFDRQIYVGTPDVQGRQDILKIYARDKRLDEQVDLKAIALATAGFTGADLENLLNEAAILAVREKRQVITTEDLNEAMMKIIAGPQKKSRKQLQRDLRITAIHEAGHAVAMYRLPNHDPVHQITIVPRGRANGLTVSLPEEETSHMTRNEMYEEIVAGLGGRVAEALFCQDISTGASQDIRHITQVARDMVAKYGMSEKIGPIAYSSDEEVFIGRDYEKTKSYSEQVAGLLDGEVREIIDRAYRHCEKILQEDREKLFQVVEFLLAHETMSGAQFKACMEGRDMDAAGPGSLFDPI
ncbi:aTP-dependent zinc metalloprotease FtsH 1 [Firmicutes bacterium CAG:137]|nr:aTP-dependent zinc metalloprotease FtsH 1 [Firmicutes bacterium CAG:137]